MTMKRKRKKAGMSYYTGFYVKIKFGIMLRLFPLRLPPDV